MEARTLTPFEKEIIWGSIYNALRKADPAGVAQETFDTPGGLDQVTRQIDQLVDIARRTTADHIEPYEIQILNRVCSRCPSRQPDALCALRMDDRCLLARHPREVMQAIATALEALEDLTYLANHPSYTLRATNKM